jgi:hypothetical protein
MTAVRGSTESLLLPNNTFDRTAGSHALAAAGQRERSPLAPLGENQAVKTDARCAGSRLPPHWCCARSCEGRRTDSSVFLVSP